MYNLLLKDVLILKKQFLYGLFIGALFSLTFSKINGAMMCIFALPYILVFTAVAYDEKDKAEIMLTSLPIDRSLLVIERYLSVFVFAILGAMEYTIIEAIVYFTGINVEISPFTAISISSMVLGLAIFYGIYLPMMFKFGYIKTRWVNLFMFFGLFFGVTSLINAINKYGINFKILNPLITFFKNQSNIAVASELIAVAFLIYVLSYAISVKIYNSREF